MNILFLELLLFVHPLRVAVKTGENLSIFLGEFGIELDGLQVQSAFGQVQSIGAHIDDLTDLIEDAFTVAGDINTLKDIKNIPADEIAAISAKATQLYANVDDVVPALIDVANSIPQAIIFQEILDHLIDSYLKLRLPAAREVAKALDVRQATFIRKSDPSGREADYTSVRYEWSRLRQFISDTDGWADEVYGWGREFDHLKAVMTLSNLVNSFGGRTSYADVDPQALNTFVQNVPPPRVVNGVPLGTQSILEARLPVFQLRSPPDALGNLSTTGEIGILALPTGNFNAPGDMGLAIAPYADGSVSGTQALSNILSFTPTVNASATGGRYLTITPAGMNVVGGGAVDAEFELSFAFKKADDSPIILFGSPDSTRLEIGSALISLGGNLNGDIFLAAGVSALSLTLDAADDGLLSAVLSDPIVIDAGDLVLGWRLGRGVYFEGGSNIGITIPVDLQLGPINIHEFGLEFDLDDPFSLTLTTTADITIGPLFAYADGMGLKTSIVPAANGTDGLLGNKDLEFGFVAPTGYAVSLDGGAIKGGGMLSVTENEYRGALALNFGTFGFSAFGILNTQLPGGEDGFSFAASIFGEFNVPLSFGFFLTGIGGIIGVNRTIDTDALRTVLYEGRLDNLIFPADPIENAATILDDMAAILPAQEGQHLFGPVVKIGWGQPILIDVKLGVVIEVGENVRILILGGLSAVIPSKEAALIDLNITFFGEIDFAAKTISFDATLTNSRILTFTISGDAAVRSGWGPRMEHIVSFGGLHPQFPKPSNLPDLRRITINFGTNNPKVTITAYTAITSNSLQFGGRADLYAKGPKIWLLGQFAAEGWIYLDALVYFDPFAFDVALGGGLNLLRNGNVIVGLGFDLRLRGPNTLHITGKAWITVFGKDIKVPINHRWGSSQSITLETVSAVDTLKLALEKSPGFESLPPAGRVSGVSFTALDETERVLDPLGGLRLVQRAVPLDLNIQKIGEAQLQSGIKKVDIQVKDRSGNIVTIAPETQDFVRGHFFQLTDAERLRATAFERHKAGFSLGDRGMTGPTNKAVSSDYSYEFVFIPIETEKESDILSTLRPRGALADIIARFAVKDYQDRLGLAQDYGKIVHASDRLKVQDPGYVANINAATAATAVIANATRPASAGRVDAQLRETFQADGLAELTLTGAHTLQTQSISAHGKAANPVVEDYVLAAGGF